MISSVKHLLMVFPFVQDERLGAAKNQMGLAEEFRLRGIAVDFFTLDQVFPWRRYLSSRKSRLIEFFLPPFRFYAHSFVKRHGYRFDVIDCMIGSIAAPAKTLSYNGLLVSRSVGFTPTYVGFSKQVHGGCGRQGRFLEEILTERDNRRELKGFEQACRISGAIIAPTIEERDLFRVVPGCAKEVHVVPLGVRERDLERLRADVLPAVQRLRYPKVTMIAEWGVRKGCRDWPAIIEKVKRQLPNTSFCFLGTNLSAQEVLRELPQEHHGSVTVHPRFFPAELPGLLANSTVGAFSSYLEGFGIAPVEQMAAGVPVIAYDVPGPRDSVGKLGSEFLTPVGDTEKFADQIVRVLQTSEHEYQDLSERCYEVAKQFSLRVLAQKTLDVYCRAK